MIRTAALILCLALLAADRVLEIRIPATGPVTVTDSAAPATQPAWLDEATDLSNVLKGDGSDTHLKPHGSYHFNGLSPAIKGTIRLVGDDTEVHYDGPLGAVIFDCQPSQHDSLIQGIHWINDHPTPDFDQGNNPTFCRPSGRNLTIQNCTWDGFDEVNLGETVPPLNGLLVENCSTSDLRGCFFYGAVTNAVFRNDQVGNSTRQEAMRLQGADTVLVDRCTFEDEDHTATGDPNDRAKSPLRIYKTANITVTNSVFRTWVVDAKGNRTLNYANALDIGPLTGTDAPLSSAGDRTSNVTFRDCEFVDAALSPGTQQITFDHCTIRNDAGTGILANAADVRLNRLPVDGLTITNCLFTSASDWCVAVRLYPGAKNVRLDNCAVAAPNVVSKAEYDSFQLISDDSPWPGTITNVTLQEPAKFGPPGNAVARIGQSYLSEKDLQTAFPTVHFGKLTEAQAVAAGVGVRP